MKIYDISIQLKGDTIHFPGDDKLNVEKVMNLENGDFCNLSSFSMSAHFGTHIDSPAHFIASGKTIGSYECSRFVLPTYVMEVADVDSIEPEDLVESQILEGGALLLKTQNSRLDLLDEQCRDNFCHISVRCAEFLASKKISLLGVDYISPESFEDENYPVHKILLSNDILILETIDLRGVPQGKYTLICLPLKITGIEASPVRAVLIDTDELIEC